MPPNLDDENLNFPDIQKVSDNIENIDIVSSSSSIFITDEISSYHSIQSEIIDNNNIQSDEYKDFISLEHNIYQLLTRVSNTDQLETVTQINLRVIARDLPLQQLGIYLPTLRELTLDGSIISSLRDLGNGLKNLKILSVNRCQINCIDGVLGFEILEEFYAADNAIKDLTPCAFFTNIKIIDIRRNNIKTIASLHFLNFCEHLKKLFINGNEVVDDASISNFSSIIGSILLNLEYLDDIFIMREEIPLLNIEKNCEADDVDEESTLEDTTFQNLVSFRQSPRIRRNSRNLESLRDGFRVRFPPRAFRNNEGL